MEENVHSVTPAPFSEEQESITRTSLEHEQILSGQFWGELRVFLAVAKGKSFNRAAEMLHTSQPTVSRQVKRLQDLMGSQLFVPTQHGVKLTPKGQELATQLSKLDHSLFSLTNDLRAEKQEAEGVVRISITDGLNACFVAPALRRENQTDLMIGFMPVHATDIVTRKLGCMHFIPIASKSYIQEHGLPTRSNLSRHLFLQSEMYAAATGMWNEWKRIIAAGRVAHYCDNTFAYGMLVKAGLGIGLLGSYTVLEPASVPLELMEPVAVPLYAIALTDRLNSRPVRAAFDWLCGIFGNDNPWFSEEFKLDIGPSEYDAGFKAQFNL